MGEGIASFVVVILVFAGILFGFYHFSEWVDSNREAEIHAQCQERYGEPWVGKYHYRNPPMCVNAQGDVKYLQ